jgi:ribosome-binding factor A
LWTAVSSGFEAAIAAIGEVLQAKEEEDMPDDIRIKRIEAFFLQELSRIVSRELKNPIFENKLISFSGIKVSRDLSIAHVAVSVFGGGDPLDDVVKALTEAEPIIRRQIRASCDLRKVPIFEFHGDRSMENAARIEKILDSLDIPAEEPAETCDDLKAEEASVKEKKAGSFD